MLKRLYKKCKEKKDGNYADLVGTSVCLLVLMIMLLVTVHFTKILEFKRIINNYAREYLLILEENGELKPEEVTALTNKIHGIGFNNVTIKYNETNTKVDFGNEVSIEVQVLATWQELGISKVLSYIKDEYNVSTKLYSTSKT